MDAGVGRETDTLEFLAGLADAPYRYDFYQTLRRLECLYRDKPRWGEALRPVEEPLRLGQDPDLSFAPASLATLLTDGRRPRLQVALFGLLGPNGPLPIHLTDYTRERLRHAGDPTLSRFLDLFHHRFLALFYRAWAQAQPHVNRDRPEADRFAGYVGALLGIRPAAFRHRDAVPDEAKLFHAGTLVRHVRNAEGLQTILRQFFRVPVAVEQFAGHWMVLDPREHTHVGREGALLGAGAIVGRRIWDRQHKIRIRVGALRLDQYENFLPGGTLLRKLADWVRFYLSFELDWDVRLVLQRAEVPRLSLDGRRRLGWTTWLGRRTQPDDAADLCLHVESVLLRIGESLA